MVIASLLSQIKILSYVYGNLQRPFLYDKLLKVDYTCLIVSNRPQNFYLCLRIFLIFIHDLLDQSGKTRTEILLPVSISKEKETVIFLDYYKLEMITGYMQYKMVRHDHSK